MGSEGKPPGRSLRSWAHRYLNVGFVAGFLLVLLTYMIVSQQSAMSSPNAVATMAPKFARKAGIKAPIGTGMQGEASYDHQKEQQQSEEWQLKQEASGAVPAEESRKDETFAKQSDNGKIVCSRDGPFSDTCDLAGDVRINGSAFSVNLVPQSRTERREWKILPYPRRTMSGIQQLNVTQLGSPQEAPACTVTEDLPAIVFALGGLTGNYWHDFSDLLVPLFAASRQYGGEVRLLVSNIQPWWLGKYEAVVRRLSRHDAVDLDRDGEVRCFPRAAVGLRMHKEFSIAPELAPGGRLSMADFTAFLRETYALPRAAAPASLKPRLLLIHRGHYRRFVNVAEIVQGAESAGFEVTALDPRADAGVEELARTVNSFDVLVGVHGAGLTNAVFLPAGAVVIQVVPYGKLERMARVDFGDPVADMGLRYLEYSISAEESTLLEMLGPDHPVIKDPEAVHRSGWDKVAEFYLGKQDVRLDVDRFAPTLAQALDHLRQQ